MLYEGRGHMWHCLNRAFLSCFHCSVGDTVYSPCSRLCYWTNLNYHDGMKEKSIAETTVRILLRHNSYNNWLKLDLLKFCPSFLSVIISNLSPFNTISGLWQSSLLWPMFLICWRPLVAVVIIMAAKEGVRWSRTKSDKAHKGRRSGMGG